jgi:hypothetical protein
VLNAPPCLGGRPGGSSPPLHLTALLPTGYQHPAVPTNWYGVNIDPLKRKVKPPIIKHMTMADFNAEQIADADARHREVIEAWRQGKTLAEIAADTGRTVGRIHQIITRARLRGLLHDPERQRPRKSAQSTTP